MNLIRHMSDILLPYFVSLLLKLMKVRNINIYPLGAQLNFCAWVGINKQTLIPTHFFISFKDASYTSGAHVIMIARLYKCEYVRWELKRLSIYDNTIIIFMIDKEQHRKG